MKIILPFILIILSSCTFGQSNSKFKSSYLNQLIYGDSNSRCGSVIIGYNYLSTPSSGKFSAKGGHTFVGLNIARFFSDKFVIAPILEFKNIYGKTRQNFNNAFKNDFNLNYLPITDASNSQLESESFYNGLNNISGFSFEGNQFWNFGLAFSPFPDRYGGFMLKVSKGSQLFSFLGEYDKQLYVDDLGVYLELIMKRNIALELAFHPFDIKNHTYKSIFSKNGINDFYKNLSISFYYEQLSFIKNDFRTTPLTDFIQDDFFLKHSRLNNFGFKIGLSAW